MMACAVQSAHCCICRTEAILKLCDAARVGATRNTSDPLCFGVGGCVLRNLTLFQKVSQPLLFGIHSVRSWTIEHILKDACFRQQSFKDDPLPDGQVMPQGRKDFWEGSVGGRKE